jgi:mono/diheme cytochrome c family protein
VEFGPESYLSGLFCFEWRRATGKSGKRRNISRSLFKVPERMFTSYRRWLLMIMICAPLCLAAQATQGSDGDTPAGPHFSPEAAATFNKRCTACHTYGKGVKVGPDLKGVNERRKRDWLLKFIHASSKVIQSGDVTATTLFAQFKKQRMPDWTDLSDKQINDILDFIAAGGPDIKPADERNAELASATEIKKGQQLFNGEISFQHGAHACASCHSVSGSAVLGGTLGPDLSTVYTKYQDRSLTEFLRHPCFQWGAEPPPTQYLTAGELFTLKAFLRHTAYERADNQPKSNGKNVQAESIDAKSVNHQASLSSTSKVKGEVQ